MGRSHPTVRLNFPHSGGSVIIGVTGVGSGSGSTGHTAKLQYAADGSNYVDLVSAKSSKSSGTFYYDLSATLPGTQGPTAYSATASKFQVVNNGTVISGSQKTLSSLLDQISKPSSQPVFSTWLSQYDGAKSTLSDVLTAFGKFQNGDAPTSGGGDGPGPGPGPGPDPGGDVDMPPLPAGMSVTW